MYFIWPLNNRGSNMSKTIPKLQKFAKDNKTKWKKEEGEGIIPKKHYNKSICLGHSHIGTF
jgi:hypothetical protein